MQTPPSADEPARTASAAASISDTTVQKQPKRAAAAAFMGTAIEYGNDEFKTFEEIITFFERLGGQ